MKRATVATSATALVALLAASTTAAAPLEKRLMMALSIQASPTLPNLNALGGLIPTPTLPPIASEIESVITSVIDGVTQLIPTLIPVPTSTPSLPIDGVTDLLTAVAAATPTPTADPTSELSNVLGDLAMGALNAYPSMLLQNLAAIQSEASSIIASAATATPTPITYITTESGKECTKTFTPTIPTFATTGVINPLSVLANALPNPTAVQGEITSVIAGVTSILTLPSLPLPTGLLPLLGTAQLPQIDLPGLMGNGQDVCVKDASGNQIGLCGSGPVLNDSETLNLV